jgi:hypothetical protein
VIADPFISPFGLTITPALSYAPLVRKPDLTRASESYLKVEEDTVSATPCLPLAYDDNGHG